VEAIIFQAISAFSEV